MLFISHRGNLNGPIPERENSPDYIDAAIAAGFVVEVDLTVDDGWPILGHKNQRYPVSWTWLENRSKNLLLHLKNYLAVHEISKNDEFHYFCNEQDPYSLTSKGYILYWSRNPSKDIPNRHCLLPAIGFEDMKKLDYPCSQKIGGVISDYIEDVLCHERYFT